jgi:cytochrome c553
MFSTHSASERSIMKTCLIAVFAVAAFPSVVSATSTSRQEFLDATRAKPNLENGAELFSTCAACHGKNGEGTSDGSVPSIGGQHLTVLVKQLVDFRHNRRWDIRMEHFADRHHLKNAQDIADVAGYVNQLPTRQQTGIGDGKSVGHGATVYFQHCESCHGATGQGDANNKVPRLAGQHYEYLERQFHDTADGRRPNMNHEHVRVFRRLEMQDFVGLADYLSRLIPEGARRTE